MPTIFELVTAPELTAYWEQITKDRPPYLGETLWPAQKKLGLDLKWIKGSQGLPVVLKPSAFDVNAVPRPRIGFERLSAQMPFFKESTYIDEELRQQLNMVLETGNQAYIDSVMNQVFNDEVRLLEGARARREMMRMMALTTGTISILGALLIALMSWVTSVLGRIRLRRILVSGPSVLSVTLRLGVISRTMLLSLRPCTSLLMVA